jgi:hypothetical protein
METYFIRHTKNMGVDQALRDRMWKEPRVFIHYPWDKNTGKRHRVDSRSKHFEDYERGAKWALRRMLQLGRTGGYVCAHYPEHEKWLVGLVPENSRVQLCQGMWKKGDRPKGHNGIAIVKTLRLKKSCLIFPDDYAVLQTAQPRQGTIMRWRSARDAIEAIVLRKKIRRSFDALDATNQETMCAEFLRLPAAKKLGLPQLACLLRDVGRTMKDLDIVGIATTGRRIFAQVTYYSNDSKNALEKREALRKFKGHKGTHLILFCNCEKPVSKNGITVFPIREIYRYFCKTRTGKLWLNHVFHRI